ncbi:MAG: CoA-acylating methylmalonate-semialdehyde dehydrogenase [Rhodothermales bacterium]|nr:CoA-acylating methylmalonate-semialdehyde dehydrogenase [Rhodothermales bacterium]MBO6779953.1 CoA-acylating methylmalonate-semialdehyde dehydrogenase [Rhodothermales bacterium]
MSVMVEQSVLPNVIGGERTISQTARHLPVTAPRTGEVITEVPLSTASELSAAVAAAAEAQKAWAGMPLKDRVQVMYRLKALMARDEDRICEVITLENGKTIAESRGEVLRAVECVEFAASLPQTATGNVMEVSAGVQCRLERVPMGVVAGITPFNFPFMVPLWMIPMAIALGNAFILKPSEQTPLSAMEIARLLDEAGLPPGIFSVVHGDREIVEAICDNPGISAVGFIGSSRVAKLVFDRGSVAGKRVRAMGGAKNHLVVVPDADPEMTASNVTSSVTGCAGQRCMAASVLVAVGECDHILDRITEHMARLEGGRDIGAIISEAAYDRITGYLDRAEAGGAVLALDGRKAVAADAPAGGRYLGASIIDHAKPDHEASCEEIFGPTLTVIRCDTLEEAIAIENANPYGNAAAIYTSSGGTAQYFADRASAGMIGVNIGVPVPREPFAFGGWNESAFGGGDITGNTAIDFWTKARKITTKWEASGKANWMS